MNAYTPPCVQHSGVEQLAARRAHNPEVVGSSPTPATNSSQIYRLQMLVSFYVLPAGLAEFHIHHAAVLMDGRRIEMHRLDELLDEALGIVIRDDIGRD